jgi:YgiT-type zinc finger domain-containing protein
MKKEKSIRCTVCEAKIEFKTISQDFERERLGVSITGIPAAVCPQCGDISFAPGVAARIVRMRCLNSPRNDTVGCLQPKLHN